MSKTFRISPISGKIKSSKIDKNSKSVIRQKILNIYYNDKYEDMVISLKEMAKNLKFKLAVLLACALLSSCVSKRMMLKVRDDAQKTSTELENCLSKNDLLNGNLEDLSDEIKKRDNMILNMEMQLANERNKVHLLEQQLDYFKNTNTNLLDRLSDLSVVNKAGAESIKRSLEALNEQNRYIKDLTSSIRQKDSLNLVLVMNLKRSLADIDDEDINIEVKKGVVYISISDKLMFKSGSAEISSRAETVLGKIAKVLNDHKQLDILVEGHTDNVPISNSCIVDNWDLSVKRATSVARQLQIKHGIQPERMTAGGRSEYIPKSDNTTTEGRAANRRTEIIILPKLDQFFELLEPMEKDRS